MGLSWCWKSGRGGREGVILLGEKVKEDGEERSCASISPSPRISVTEWREEEQRRRKVTLGGKGWRGAGEKERKGGKVCWSSCVLAVSGRGVVGIGQV